MTARRDKIIIIVIITYYNLYFFFFFTYIYYKIFNNTGDCLDNKYPVLNKL